VTESQAGESPTGATGHSDQSDEDIRETSGATPADEDSSRGRPSLLAGRSTQPLGDREVRAVAETFAGLDYDVPTRYDATGRTSFSIETDEFGSRTGIVVYGRDIYPGVSVIDPNSALGMQAAAAHEISHYYRWRDRTELPELKFEYLDEALTSLDAAMRFTQLSPHHVRQLVLDAMQRIQLHYLNATRPDAD